MRGERIERYAWSALLIVPTVGLVIGVRGLVSGAPGNPALVDALTGLDWEALRTREPGVARLVAVLERHQSLALLAWAFWLALTNIQGYRSRSSWIWWGWWSVPVFTIGFGLAGARVGGGFGLVRLALTALAVVALLVSRRWFLSSGSVAPRVGG
jgi:hypothetical protein